MPTGVYVRTDEHRAATKKAQNDPEVKARHSAATKKAYEDPEVKARHSAAINDPEVRAKKSAATKKAMNDPEVKARHSAAINDPEVRAKKSAGARKAHNDPEVKARHSAGARKAHNDPEVKARHSAAMNDPEVKARHSAAMNDPEVKARHSAATKKAMNDPEVKMRRKETYVGGFCIQNIIYDEREGYCEVWGPGLWRRIDAYQDNRSIISGKTKEDNNGKELTRHHLYWQKKACCGYDEDTKGYYAMINLGTRGKPEVHKHYIKGSPNKFVLLTSHEHGIIKGNKKLGTNKLTWIKVLEDLVEIKLNGKTFYTEFEYANLEV